jgi:hypothetical protein
MDTGTAIKNTDHTRRWNFYQNSTFLKDVIHSVLNIFTQDNNFTCSIQPLCIYVNVWPVYPHVFTNKNDSKKISRVYHVLQTPKKLDWNTSNKLSFTSLKKKSNKANHARFLYFVLHLFSLCHHTRQHTIACSPSEVSDRLSS